MHQPFVQKDDDMTEAKNEPLEKLVTKLHRLNKGPVELGWELRVFRLSAHYSI